MQPIMHCYKLFVTDHCSQLTVPIAILIYQFPIMSIAGIITTWICAKGYPTRARITTWDQLAALEVFKIEIL